MSLFSRRISPVSKTRRKSVVIEQMASSRGAAGDPTQTWTPVGNAWWVEIEPRRALEVPLSGAQQSVVEYVITGRYRSGVTAKMRVRYGTRTFNIVGVRNLGEANHWLELDCEEGLNVGN